MNHRPTDELAKLPHEILVEVVRLQDEIDWVNTIPAYCEWIAADGSHFFCGVENVTIAILEQSVEYHTRKARTAIKRWLRTRSKTTLRTAAWHILRARTWRCQYFILLGQHEFPESEMPFPCR